jgi:hypothetical protein
MLSRRFDREDFLHLPDFSTLSHRLAYFSSAGDDGAAESGILAIGIERMTDRQDGQLPWIKRTATRYTHIRLTRLFTHFY